MMDSLEILKENNHIDCSNALLDLISSEINDSENYSLGLSGGSTPKFFYELFAEKYKNYSNIYLWTIDERHVCLLYTSPSPRDATLSRMPSSA